VVAMASNAVLKRKAEEAIEIARLISGLTDDTEHEVTTNPRQLMPIDLYLHVHE
jgi:hypothetical protein